MFDPYRGRRAECDPAMKLLRRILAALAMAGIAAAGVRIRGTGGIPPQHGGWRPLELPPEKSKL